jgi:hypothetical protein
MVLGANKEPHSDEERDFDVSRGEIATDRERQL